MRTCHLPKISTATRSLAIVIFGVSAAACSKWDVTEFAQDTRIRAENIGAEEANKKIAYPTASYDGGSISTLASEVASKPENERPSDKTEEVAAPSAPSIIFYNPK